MAEIFTAWSPSYKQKLGARSSPGTDVAQQSATCVLRPNKVNRRYKCPIILSLNATIFDGLNSNIWPVLVSSGFYNVAPEDLIQNRVNRTSLPRPMGPIVCRAATTRMTVTKLLSKNGEATTIQLSRNIAT